MIEDDEMFACIRCGKQVYYSHAVTYCPHCGLDFLPEGYGEGADLPAAMHSSASSHRFGPMVTVIGSGIMGLIVDGVCYFAFIHLSFPATAYIPFLVASCLGAFASGYSHRAMSDTLPRHLGIAYGLLNTLPAALMTLSGRLAFPAMMSIAILFAVICTLSAFAGGIVYDTLFRRANILPETVTSDDALYLELLQRLGFDHARVRRMLDLDRQIAPMLSRRELLQRAIERVHRDNR